MVSGSWYESLSVATQYTDDTFDMVYTSNSPWAFFFLITTTTTTTVVMIAPISNTSTATIATIMPTAIAAGMASGPPPRTVITEKKNCSGHRFTMEVIQVYTRDFTKKNNIAIHLIRS